MKKPKMCNWQAIKEVVLVGGGSYALLQNCHVCGLGIVLRKSKGGRVWMAQWLEGSKLFCFVQRWRFWETNRHMESEED